MVVMFAVGCGRSLPFEQEAAPAVDCGGGRPDLGPAPAVHALRFRMSWLDASAPGEQAVVADVDRDGHLDLVTRGLAVYRGAGDGTFAPPQHLLGPAPTLPNAKDRVTVGDFRHDGTILGYSTSEEWKTIWGGGGPDGPGLTGFIDPSGLESADMNRDGLPDMITAVGPDGVMVLVNFGHTAGPPGSLVFNPQSWNTPFLADRAWPADFNGDGAPDLLVQAVWEVASPPALQVFLNSNDQRGVVAFAPGVMLQANPGGAKANPATYSTPNIGDLNGDGRADLVLNLVRPDGTTILAVYPGAPDGAFAAPIVTPAPDLDLGLLGDFDGDGKLDALMQAKHLGQGALMAGQGDGTFSPPQAVEGEVGCPFGRLAAADINRDGRLDFVATAAGGAGLCVMVNESN